MRALVDLVEYSYQRGVTPQKSRRFGRVSHPREHPRDLPEEINVHIPQYVDLLGAHDAADGVFIPRRVGKSARAGVG